MPGFGGAALKLLQTVNYALCFCCAAIILGFYSYFLSVLADRNETIPTWEKAVEGISGAAVLYTIFAVVLTCFLGGIRIFAFFAILVDVLLCGAFIALAVLTRHGTQNCSGSNVDTPLGNGASSSKNGFNNDSNVVYSVSLGTACRYNKACFAVSLIGAFLFLVSAITQIWLARHHQREKKFGPSPKNNYTSGSGSRWYNRKRGAKKTTPVNHKTHDHHHDAEKAAAAGGLAAPAAADHRFSHETGYTGTTAGDSGAGTYTGTKYETPAGGHPAHQAPLPTTAGGYHTGPTGTAVNPYGYDNQRTAGTNF